MSNWIHPLLQQNTDGGDAFKVLIGVAFFILWIVAQIASSMAEKRKKREADEELEGGDVVVEAPPPPPQRRVPFPGRPGTYPPIPQQQRRQERKPKPPKPATSRPLPPAMVAEVERTAYTLPRDRTGGGTSGLSAGGLPTAGGRGQLSPAVVSVRARMSPTSLREGILLAEILKPPVALRDEPR
jgi:hypothetical protein